MPAEHFQRSRWLLLPLLLAALAACDPAREQMIMAAPASDIDLQISTELQDLLDRKSHIRLRLTDERMSGEEALDALAAGEVDIAFVSNYQPYRDGVATVMPLYPTVLHIAHRRDIDASDPVAMLSGADIYAGADGSASRLVFERIASRLGLKEGDVSFVDRRHDAEGMDVDVAIAFAPISPQFEEEFAAYRFLTLGSPEDIGAGSTVDAAVLVNPRLRPFVIPKGTYGSATPEPVLTMAVDKILVASSDVDPSLIYDLIGEVLRLRPAISVNHPALFDELRDDFDISQSTFVLHKGAQAFLRRMEPSVYERYSGAAEVVITLLIAVTSASLAGVRIFRRRRKNRIDEFYAAAIRFRDSINDESSSTEREAAAKELKALQDNAFGKLIDEQLDADDSFRIFITLSDDVLKSLQRRG
jgi:TRAP-type uncharacterized transport system substrate-binding protein